MECASCKHIKADRFTALRPSERHGECKEVLKALEQDIKCLPYCMGGYPVVAEVSLDFFCARYERAEEPT